jgi:hypothetical protein
MSFSIKMSVLKFFLWQGNAPATIFEKSFFYAFKMGQDWLILIETLSPPTYIYTKCQN